MYSLMYSNLNFLIKKRKMLMIVFHIQIVVGKINIDIIYAATILLLSRDNYLFMIEDRDDNCFMEILNNYESNYRMNIALTRNSWLMSGTAFGGVLNNRK